MLKGEKHFALFHDALPLHGNIPEEIIPEQTFARYVSNGRMKRFCREYSDGTHIIRYVCFTLPGHEWRAQAFFYFHEQARAGKRPYDDAYDYFVGRLLDYSEADIRHYLANATSLHTAA